MGTTITLGAMAFTYFGEQRTVWGIQNAGLWIPANMLAWLVGMPVIFWGIDMAQRGLSIFQAIALLAAVLLLVGTIVGAINGAFLVKLAKKITPQ